MKLRIGKNAAAFAYLVVFCLILILLTATGLSDRFPEVIFVVYLAGMVLFLLFVSRGVLKTSNDRILFWSATLIKIAYAMYRFPITEIANPSLSGDAGGFWRTAVQYYEGNFNRVYTPFPYVLNAEFHLFGKNVLCCCITNIVFSMLMVLIVVKVMNGYHIYGKGRLLAMLVSAFLVYGIQVCNSILREAIYFVLITGSFYEYVLYVRNRQQIKLYLALLLMVPVLVLHIGYFPIVTVYIIDLFLHEKVRTKKALLNRAILIAVFIVFVVYASRLNSVGLYLTRGQGIVGIINRIVGSNSDEYSVEAGSRYLAGMRITSIPTFLLYSPIKWVFYTFSPLPTNWRGLTDILAFLLDGCVHFICLWTTISCMRCLKRSVGYEKTDQLIRIIRTGFWSVVLCGFMFGLGTSTAGTAIRHRDVMIGIEAVLIGLSVHFKNADLSVLERIEI